jgi:hypothetical protein
VNLASAQRHALFCLRGLLEVIVTDLLQCRDDAGAAALSTAKFDVQALRRCGVAALRLRRGHSIVRQ